jgi:transposase
MADTAQSRNDLGARIQALVLLERGVHHTEITEITGVSKSSVYGSRKIAKERGYDPSQSKSILLRYVEDAPRSGRPPIKPTEAAQTLAVEAVTKD